MKVVQRALDSIRPYEKNPRKNQDAVEAVMKSIKEFGFRQPIVVDKRGIIICGHTRWMAAKQLGLKKVPVHVATELTPDQVRAYRLADNRLAEIAEWDDQSLALELSELEGSIDLKLLGFSDEELGKLLDTLGDEDDEVDIDSAPELPDKPITKRGDIWQLGNHRLMCGDSGSDDDVDRLLGGRVVDLVNTGRPYYVKLEPRSGRAIIASKQAGQLKGRQRRDLVSMTKRGRKARGGKLRPKDRVLQGDYKSDEEFRKTVEIWFKQIHRVLKSGGVFYVWGGYSNLFLFPDALQKAELHFAQAIVWAKKHPILTNRDFMSDHEWCFYGWKPGAPHYFNAKFTSMPDVWEVPKLASQKMVHLTEKPGELARRAIRCASRRGETALDLFGGSGSTLAAAEQLGRQAYLMELDSLYCDVIVKRWEELAGKRARRVK